MKTLIFSLSLLSAPAAMAGLQSGGSYKAIPANMTIKPEIMDSLKFESTVMKIYSSSEELRALQDFETVSGQRGVLLQDGKGNWRVLLEKEGE